MAIVVVQNNQSAGFTPRVVGYCAISILSTPANPLDLADVDGDGDTDILGAGAWIENSTYPIVSDISTTLETKLTAVRCYQTQFPPAKDQIFERLRAMAIANGALSGFEAGEVFHSTKMIGSRDLMHSLLDFESNSPEV